jgi:hypothetical protein
VPWCSADGHTVHVKAAARAFTGWNLRGADYYFVENQRDVGDKTFSGPERRP